ncbi:MAG TPA: hypothetical protein PKG88_05390 [Bacteroidales bacterium]|nr:hypothetical protein [Bacteroidales bacterium]HPS72339.1 hypothetical protein [Bacteroidales bacterium]
MNDKTQIKIKRLDFSSFDDKTLGWICIEPTIQKIRGKNLTIKSQVYAQLTSGQKTLLLFWILYGHTQNGIIQFFNEVDYLLVNNDLWFEFKERFKLFNNDDLLDLVNDLESFYSVHIKRNRLRKFDNDSDAELITRLDIKINYVMPELIKKISDYIRNNPKDFVNLYE